MTRRKINEYLFYISYTLILITTMFTRVSIISKLYTYIDLLSLLIIFINCILASDKFTRKDLLIFFLILTISFISYYVCDSNFIFKLFLIIYSARNLNFDECVKKDFKIKLLLFISVVALHFLGLTNDYIMIRSDGTIRNSMGFSHPNIFGIYILMLCLEYVYIHDFKSNKTQYFILVVLIFIVNYFANSRASMLVMLLMLLTCIFKKTIFYLLENKKWIKKIATNSFLILSIFTLFLTVLYQQGSDVGIEINKLTSNRISSISQFYNKYGLHLFGSKLTLVSTEVATLTRKQAYILDNSYANLIIQYGVLIYIIIGIFFKKSFNKMYNDKNYSLMLVFILLLIYGIMENSILKISYNFFLIYFCELFHKKEKSVEKDEQA